MSAESLNPPIVPLAAFEGCDFEAPIAGFQHIDMVTISLAYIQAAAKASSPYKEVFLLLSSISGIHLNPAERGAPWIAGTVFGDRRSMIPSDIRGEQSDVLELVFPRVKHPALRARIGDLVWSNDMRKADAARAAIDSYCDCLDGLIDGSLKASYPVDGRDLVDSLKPAHRALQMASATTKKGAQLPNRVTSVMTTLYGSALSEGQPVIFSRIAQLCVDYKIIETKQVAADVEVLATANLSLLPDALRMAFDFAQNLYHRLGDAAAEQRCAMAAVHQLLRMRDQVNQAGAKAAWVMDALLRLRHIKCDDAVVLENTLEEELRRLQRASLREMGSFPVDIVVPGEEERILDLFSKMDFSTALKSFALLDNSPKTEDLKIEALKQGQGAPLNAMMGVKHIDHEGKTVVNTAGAGRGEPPEDWYMHMIGRSESLRRAAVVVNNIEPVRLYLNSRVAIEERHLNPIVWQSHFVPQTHAPIWGLGFARFFQGDFISAAHLLIPQLEPSLRQLLKAHGVDPTKRRDDATEEDRSIDAIIANHRPALIAILGEPLLDELNRVFNLQPGPALRHDVAHGQMSAGECYAPDSIYACWLLYRVCCLFLMGHWDEWVRPGLAIEEPGL